MAMHYFMVISSYSNLLQQSGEPGLTQPLYWIIYEMFTCLSSTGMPFAVFSSICLIVCIPRPLALWIGVFPENDGSLGLAPYLSNSAMMSVFSVSTAWWRGVRPLLPSCNGPHDWVRIGVPGHDIWVNILQLLPYSCLSFEWKRLGVTWLW